MSTPTLKELREEQQALYAEMRALNEKEAGGETPTAEEIERFEKCSNRYDEVKPQIDRIERSERWQSIHDETAALQQQAEHDTRSERRRIAPDKVEVTDEIRANALQGWACLAQGKSDLLREDHRFAFQALGMQPGGEFRVKLPSLPVHYRHLTPKERRDLTVGTTTEGGHTVPDEFVRSLEVSMLAHGGMRSVAQIIRTADNGQLTWPTMNDLSNTGELLAEAGAITLDNDPVFGALVLDAYKYGSGMVQVTAELLEDSAFNLAVELGTAFGVRIARATNAHFTTGTGSGQPNGMITAGVTGVTAAAVAAIDPDEIFDLVHSVDPAYRSGAQFMCHDNTVLALRKLADTTGQYLWQPGLTEGTPDRLLTYPIVINQDMDSSLAATDDAMAFGQLSAYKIRDVEGFRIHRANELYLANDLVGFVALSRHDGDLIDPGTDMIKLLTMAAS